MEILEVLILCISGLCGSGYAFAAIGAVEGRMQLQYGSNAKLSEQEAMECTNGCRGGKAEHVFDYLKKMNGATYTSYNKYDFKKIKKCVPTFPRVPHTIAYKYAYAHSVDHPDEYSMRWALVNRGPLYVLLKVYDNFYDLKDDRIYDSVSGKYHGYHAVLLVGYGTEGGKKYWTFKNSWGVKWGAEGFFRMLRGTNLCEIEAGYAAYPYLI
jgi:C1A family cysteine protease